VAQSLLQSGDIVLIADANGVRDIYSSDGRPLDAQTPLAVLVNRGTASASEVRGGRGRRGGALKGGGGLASALQTISIRAPSKKTPPTPSPPPPPPPGRCWRAR
jgi:hypothetical protein